MQSNNKVRKAEHNKPEESGADTFISAPLFDVIQIPLVGSQGAYEGDQGPLQTPFYATCG
ncbi:MAG: hypothetical protein AAGA67_14190 [Cyanobacteria bacterium P01_F01_bin.153]